LKTGAEEDRREQTELSHASCQSEGILGTFQKGSMEERIWKKEEQVVFIEMIHQGSPNEFSLASPWKLVRNGQK
jgi:hypothetical protein